MTKNREIRTIKYKVDRKYQIKANKKIKRKVNHDNKEKKKDKIHLSQGISSREDRKLKSIFWNSNKFTI